MWPPALGQVRCTSSLRYNVLTTSLEGETEDAGGQREVVKLFPQLIGMELAFKPGLGMPKCLPTFN